MRSTLGTFQLVALVMGGAALFGPVTAHAQTPVRDPATAYGAWPNAKGLPANTNPAQINNRSLNRLEKRLSFRIESYRLGALANPTAAFQATSIDEKSRTTPVIAPPQPVDCDAEGRDPRNGMAG